MAVQRDKVIASAEKLVAKGKIEPAIKEYERLLEDNPNDVNTLNRIGDLWVRINRNDEAVKVFSKIADHYSKDGFFLKAIAIYKKINKLDPSKLDVYAKLAELYAKQGLAMEAKSQYQVLADYYLKHGDPGNALAIYRKISELDPNSINVHVKLADLYSQNNQTAEALKEYDRVGRMLLKRGMLEEAVQVFRKALRIEPRNTELVDSLVTALVEAKDYENAKQLVETALEVSRDNPRLLAMSGKIQLARGDAAGARATLEKAQAADPNEPSVRDALADLYLKKGDADRALDMVTPIVEKALARGERGAAVEALNRILRVDSGNAATLERLVAVYTRLNEETNILASMNSLAEAHIAKGRHDEAARVLEKLIQREPQNAQHRTKLQFVRSQSGGVDTMPTRPKTPTPEIPALEIEEPAPSFDFSEEPAMSLDLDTATPVEIDFSLDEPAPAPVAPPPTQPPPSPQQLMPAVEIAAAEISESDDLDFITEHLTEAEVFAKYGLAEKAAEHLRTVLERAPKNLIAHDRLFRILLEEGEIDAARAAAQAYVAALQEQDDTGTIDLVINEFTSRGETFALAGAAPAAAGRPPTMERAMPRVPEPESISFDLSDTAEEISFDLDAGAPAELEFDLEEPVAAEEPVIELPAAEEEIELTAEPIEELSEPLPEWRADVPSATEGRTGRPPSIELEEEPAIAFEEAAAFEEPVASEPFFGMEGVGRELELEELPLEEIGEVDFYIEQELFDEARAKLQALEARFPDNNDLATRRRKLESAQTAVAPPPQPAPPPPVAPRPPVLSRDEIESELLSAIPDDDEEIAAPPPPPPPPPPAAEAPPPMMTAALVEEENLFADEDNFFDLAAELESELAEDEEPLSLSEEEQSLEEIFKEFKKGVEQQLDSEDYDTHYNLGIAYKEMGLIDEAIGEFQLASKDPKRAVECASMLGLCFLEKGMPQLAIKWYRKGLEMPEITEEEHIGLLYDLGSAYQEVGDTDNAQKAFMEVYGMNSNYRDIVSRIKQLEDARK
ncbi:MAG TPA: tetratricopeptide repeat protein [Thermoanaerobaculia bacterium]|nr:tetratricopeptide repeat protein [Thermoanaerobaculia bacterium]